MDVAPACSMPHAEKPADSFVLVLNLPPTSLGTIQGGLTLSAVLSWSLATLRAYDAAWTHD
jgi:hypothetical protein